MNRPETRFRTLWISDTHLGARTSQPEHLLDFLERHDADRIYLVGDLIDGLQLRRRWYWHPCKDRILALLIDKQSRGCEVVYIPGNHDAFMRRYIGHCVAGVTVQHDAVHEAADGRRLWVLHGDGYDGVHVFNPAGKMLGYIKLPETASNLCFGGPKRNLLFITASQSLYSLYVNTRGAHHC